MKKLFLFFITVLALPVMVKAKPSNADNEVSITINGATISPTDPNFYSYLQLAAAQAMAQMNRQPDEDELEAGMTTKRSRKSRKEKNKEEDAKFIRTMGALVNGIAQSAMTGNPGPAIMSAFNAVATMV